MLLFPLFKLRRLLVAPVRVCVHNYAYLRLPVAAFQGRDVSVNRPPSPNSQFPLVARVSRLLSGLGVFGDAAARRTALGECWNV
jgi:hypothetical protein